MKIARVLSAGAALTLAIVVQPALAEKGWLEKLNPFAAKESHIATSGQKYSVRKAEPSPLEKLNTGTKKFFASARDTLTWKKPAPKKKPSNPYAPWIHTPTDTRHASKAKKQSWLHNLFWRDKPKPVGSLKEWVGLPRLDP
jgi:hypothetical protein